MNRSGIATDIVVRAAMPADTALLADFFAGLSAGTCYFRFGCVSPGTQTSELAGLCNCDPTEMEHLLAFDGAAESHHIIGSMQCLICEQHGDAEFELVVADAWQGLGVGYALMQALVARLRARGLQTLQARILATNQRMIDWVRQQGFSVSTHPFSPELVMAIRVLRASDN